MSMTYVNNIFTHLLTIDIGDNVLFPKYNGTPVPTTLAGMRELLRYGACIMDVVRILGEGYDCPRSRRGPGLIERCLERGGKVKKAVGASSLNMDTGDRVWVLVHYGTFSRRR